MVQGARSLCGVRCGGLRLERGLPEQLELHEELREMVEQVHLVEVGLLWECAQQDLQE